MDEKDFVTRGEHREFCERIDKEDERQNRRLSELEQTVKQISELVTSVKVLAVNMENMSKEQAKMSERLTEIEQKPAKRWDAVIGAMISGIVGLLIGLVSAGVIR